MLWRLQFKYLPNEIRLSCFFNCDHIASYVPGFRFFEIISGALFLVSSSVYLMLRQSIYIERDNTLTPSSVCLMSKSPLRLGGRLYLPNGDAHDAVQ